MSRVFSAAGVLTALLWASTANAVSVTNRDDREVKLTVIEGEAKQDHILKPSQELKEVCQKGCVIRLNDSENDEYELEGSEVVSIEEGYLYYDGPDVPAEPSPGQTAPSPGPATK
jgi:hypothetical protein